MFLSWLGKVVEVERYIEMNCMWMKKQNIESGLAFRKIKLEELVEPLEDTWLVCEVFKTHVVKDPLECERCKTLQCTKCRKRLKYEDRCVSAECRALGNDNKFVPSLKVN